MSGFVVFAVGILLAVLFLFGWQTEEMLKDLERRIERLESARREGEPR